MEAMGKRGSYEAKRKKGALLVGKGAGVRVSTFAVLALALTGCAPKANDAVVTGEDEAAAVQVDFTWSETGDCSMCHAKEQASFEDGSCAISRHKDMACSQCHADVAALSAAA